MEKKTENRQASVELVVLSIEKNVSQGEFLQLTSELKVESERVEQHWERREK
jgi:hypothetical protein